MQSKSFVKVFGNLGFVTLLLSDATATAASLQGYRACYNAIAEKTIGPDYRMQNKEVFVPAKKRGHEGFYVFTERTVLFCRWPKQALTRDGYFERYKAKLVLEGQSPSFINFTQADKHNVPLFFENTKQVDSPEAFQEAKCDLSQNDESMEVFKKLIAQRLELVPNKFESEVNYFLQFGASRPASTASYLNALQICKLEPDLKNFVTDEMVSKIARYSDETGKSDKSIRRQGDH